MRIFCAVAVGVCLGVPAARAQTQPAVPLYRVQIVQRSTTAVNYGLRTKPAKIDFRGTFLMPEAHGTATVRSRRGVTEIKAEFQDVSAPTRFGAENLTYVLWAISPEGTPANLGELVLGPKKQGELRVSTSLQSFALIVSAEPYFAVNQPSDLVVLENIVRPGTVAKVEQVEAKYELLPRQPYVYNVGVQPHAPGGAKVSMEEYESILAMYQAQNAIQVAMSEGAERYAPDVLQKAQQLYQQAQNAMAGKADSRQVVMTAREATQVAADARVISLKRRQARNSPAGAGSESQ